MRLVLYCAIFLLLTLGGGLSIKAQSVGVVLSGGGASGLAHVGLLKALEENSIPIDYITGSSIGALVGGMYASGYSPEEIEFLMTSEAYKRLVLGQIEDKYTYYFRKNPEDASWVSLRLSSDSNLLQTSIPTSFINPVALDLEMMKMLDPASAVANYKFDSLFVPFKCVASDIEEKRSVIFDTGNLNIAIRASMSYPLYLKPIRVNGKLMFDGGLYNNFPTDIMREYYNPDVIIGCNVSSNEDPPRDDDFISQLRNMVLSKTDYELFGECCILIEPKVEYGTFNFNHLAENVDSGYIATLRQMDSIKTKIHRRVHKKVVAERRATFNAKKRPLTFTNFELQGVNKAQKKYISNVLKPRKVKEVDLELLTKGYYRLYENEKVERLYPFARSNKSDSAFTLKLKVYKEKDLQLQFGGNVASRPINTGYFGVSYNYLGQTGVGLFANTYFGKLYTSFLTRARIDLPIRLPVYFEPEFIINRWNYFKSRATFFEDNTSLFLIQNERFGLLNASFAITNKGKFSLGAGLISLRDDYYQTRTFGQDDITDKTFFSGSTAVARFEVNSHSDKLYPNKGTRLEMRMRLTEGEETYAPGTTSQEDVTLRKLHEWLDVNIKYDTYYKRKGIIRLGFYAEAQYSTLELFTNYTASILRSPSFQPTPESKTLFLESFRAYQYLALGQKVIFNILKDVDLRLEGYVFQPYRFVTSRNDFNLPPQEVLNAEKRYTITTANLVYRSPLGPLSCGLNYYHNLPEISVDDRTPLTFLFHFGYVMFNKRALE